MVDFAQCDAADAVEYRRMLTVPDDELEEIWRLYDECFRAINEETPIAQSVEKAVFCGRLVDPRITKFVAVGVEGPCGIGLLTDDLATEPFISEPYFLKKYPGQPVFLIMAIAVKFDHRALNVSGELLAKMIDEVPPNGVGIFLHSEGVNSRIPKFAEKVGGGAITGVRLDAEVCRLYSWTDGKVKLSSE